MELRGFRIKFLSAKQIAENYRKHHSDFDDERVNIYEMCRFFFQMHKGCSFFLDEVPFIKGSDIVSSIPATSYDSNKNEDEGNSDPEIVETDSEEYEDISFVDCKFRR